MQTPFGAQPKRIQQDLVTFAKQFVHRSTESIGNTLLHYKRLHYLDRPGLLSQLSPQQLWYFDAPESMHYAPPITLEQAIPTSIQPYTKPFTIEQPFVCAVPKVELMGTKAIALTNSLKSPNTILLEASSTDHQSHSDIPTAFSMLTQPISRVDLHLEAACSLIHSYGRNYFHWITEFLTRLQGVEHYQQVTGEKPRLLINANPKRWQLETLKWAGYGPADYLEWQVQRASVDRLIVPSLRRYQPQFPQDPISPQACTWLRQRILGNLSSALGNTDFSRRVFVSRRKAISRRILNEDQVMAALAPLGFRDYVLEELSFPDQVRLFSQAELIIAPHGAGLTNLLFAQNATVIELFGPPGYVRPDYFQLANANGLRYALLLGEFVNQDMRVDSEQLLRLLQHL